MRAFGGFATAGIRTVSFAPFDTVSFPEKQETEMVVWCFSPKGIDVQLYAPDQTSE